jgi:ribosomal protein L23
MKSLIEDIFSVKVISVRSLVLSHKKRRVGKMIGTKNIYKRVYVKLV